MYAVFSVNLEKLGFNTDKEFTLKLLEEEHVIVLPGALFGGHGIFRIVSLVSVEALEGFAERIKLFCERRVELLKK